jgi:hypothetical protein
VRSSPAGPAAAAIAAGASRTPPRATLDPVRWGPGGAGAALSERSGVRPSRAINPYSKKNILFSLILFYSIL